MTQDALQDPFQPQPPAPSDYDSPSSTLLAPTRSGNHKPTLTTLLTTTDLSAATETHLELPTAPPLGHGVFEGESFNPSDFLLERRHTPLEELRSDLRAYLATLRTSLVGVINEEYEAFIGLSLGLKHARISTSLATIRRPVLSIRGEVEHVKQELDEMRGEMSDVLEERKEVRELKAMMRRLLATEEAVEKVEGLLKVGKGGEKARQLDLNVDSPAKRLERIASEYTHVRYLVDRAGDLPFIHSLQPRIDQITSTLHHELSDLLSAILACDPSCPSYRPELAITLSIFASHALTAQAEDIVRSSVLKPFVKRAVHRDALTDQANTSDHTTRATTHVPPAYLLQPIEPPASSREGGNDSVPLCALYNRILTFISSDCGVLLDVAERNISVSPTPSAGEEKRKGSSAPSTEDGSGLPSGGYELLSNVILDELVAALVGELGSVIFAAGRPTVFHQHYLLTVSFIARLETLCPTLAHLDSLRSHPTYIALFKRFQLPVYFQLRFKEAVGAVERALEVGSASGGGKDGWVMSESEAVYKALRRCWDDDVWLEELAGRFWRLSLQIISRYRTWLNDQVPKYVFPASTSSANLSALSAGQPSSRSSFDGDRSRLAPSAGSTRPGTPAQSEDVSEETILRQLTVLIADARRMERRVTELFEERIRDKLAGEESASEVIATSLSSMTSLLPSLSSQIVTVLVKRCAEHLKLVRSVASQVRASTRRGTSEPSYFVHNILKELKTYLTGPGRVVEEELRKEWATAVVEDIAGRYAAILSTQKKTEDSLRWLKKGRQGLSFFGRAASSTAQSDESDDDRVKMQMQLDVETLAQDAIELGVDVEGSEAFAGLRKATTAEGKEESK